jgi:predicted DNA-binding transcriptional regulator AlpA
MNQVKSHHSLAEAAELAKCKPADLLHFAVHRKLVLLVGVPEDFTVRIFDERSNTDFEPFLMRPQLLALSQSDCLHLELHGRAKQSDFCAGYQVDSTGQLSILLPSYGRRELAHKWAYWRMHQDGLVTFLELLPDKVFVLNDEHLAGLLKSASKPSTQANGKTSDRKRKEPERREAEPLSTESQDAGKSPAPETPRKEPDLKEIAGSEATKPQNANTPEAQEGSFASNSTILRLKQVQKRCAISRSAIYDKLDSKSPRYDATFPKQIRLGMGSVGWIESDIIAWLESRKHIGGSRQ